jgi:sensor histidine kinase YesM
MTALAFGALLLMTAFTCALRTYLVYYGRISLAEWAWNCWENLWKDGLTVLGMLWIIGAVAQRGPKGGTRRALAMAAAVLASGALCVLSTVVYLWVEANPEDPPWHFAWDLVTVPLRFTLLAALLTAAGEIHRREMLSVEAMRAAETRRAVLDREALQARLQVLQAQIEPHFLFNTLANVRRLYELDARAGRAMIEQLMRYLEVALPTMRADRSTLEREAALADAYLRLQEVRMGRRLAFSIDIAAPLREAELPPMMLLTLVENAVKHGLGPLREGGRIDVAAHAQDGRLTVSVVDDGRGFGGDTSGGGTGLANIRARLAALHGDAARLELTANAMRGVRASIVLPFRPVNARGGLA